MCISVGNILSSGISGSQGSDLIDSGQMFSKGDTSIDTYIMYKNV